MSGPEQARNWISALLRSLLGDKTRRTLLERVTTGDKGGGVVPGVVLPPRIKSKAESNGSIARM